MFCLFLGCLCSGRACCSSSLCKRQKSAFCANCNQELSSGQRRFSKWMLQPLEALAENDSVVAPSSGWLVQHFSKSHGGFKTSEQFLLELPQKWAARSKPLLSGKHESAGGYQRTLARRSCRSFWTWCPQRRTQRKTWRRAGAACTRSCAMWIIWLPLSFLERQSSHQQPSCIGDARAGFPFYMLLSPVAHLHPCFLCRPLSSQKPCSTDTAMTSTAAAPDLEIT